MPDRGLEAVRKGKLSLFKRGPIWYARGTLYGNGVYQSTKTTFRTEAQKVLRQIEEHYRSGRHLERTFAHACDAYMAYGGEATYLPRLRVRLGDMPLSSIRQTDLDDAASAMFGHCTTETQNRQAYTPFIAVWNHAVGNEWAQARTWRRPRKPKGTAVRPTISRAGTAPVSYDRAWQFVSAMSPAAAMVMTMLFYTGMRPIEAFAMECEDIDVEGRWIVVRSSKTGEPRGVPMHEVLVPLLVALKARGGAVFRTHKGAPYPVTSVRVKGQLGSSISGARGRLRTVGTAIEDISPYTARHTVSTQLVIAGVHPYIKDQILGHAVGDMSRHYTHVPQAPLIEAINKLPMVDEWAAVAWMHDPIAWGRKFTRWENFGRAGKPEPACASSPSPAHRPPPFAAGV